MNSEEIKEKAFKLWENFSEERSDIKTPLIYPNLKKDSLLFIALNPSFSKKGYKKILKHSELEEFDPHQFYSWANRESFDLETAITIEKLFRKHYPYFNKIQDIAAEAQSEWEHIDLFFTRKTSQREFLTTVENRGGFNEFGRKQLDLSSEIISAINPKLIIVINAAASRIFKEEYSAKFDEKWGCHFIKLNNSTIPVILSSMLSGQRALDIFSYQRLKWHTKYIIENFYA